MHLWSYTVTELTVPVVRSEVLPSTGLDEPGIDHSSLVDRNPPKAASRWLGQSGPNAAVFLTPVPLRLDLYWCSRSASAGTHQRHYCPHHHRAFSCPKSANQASVSPELIGRRTRETELEDPPLSFRSFGLTRPMLTNVADTHLDLFTSTGRSDHAPSEAAASGMVPTVLSRLSSVSLCDSPILSAKPSAATELSLLV
jgi:hypothetical protein